MLENIKAMCKERGISLMELEKSCGIGQRSIYRWDESTPSVDKVKLVSDFFGVTIEELLENDRKG